MSVMFVVAVAAVAIAVGFWLRWRTSRVESGEWLTRVSEAEVRRLAASGSPELQDEAYQELARRAALARLRRLSRNQLAHIAVTEDGPIAAAAIELLDKNTHRGEA